MSAPVDSLSIKIDASARGANQQLDKLVQKMIQLRSTINGMNIGNLNNVSASIQNFAKAASGLNQVKTSDFTRMAKSIEKLSNIRKGELNRAASAITNISKAFSGMGNVSDGANKIAELAKGISRLGYKSTTQAIQNIPLLTKELKNMMTTLSTAPTVSNNLIAMTNAMANLGAQASGVRALGSAMNNSSKNGNRFFGAVKNAALGIKNFSAHIRSASSHNRSFASSIGLLYAKFWGLKRAIDFFGNSVKSSMDYIEEYNYFNTTMEKISSEWDKDYQKFGYENADSYGKSFEDRMTEVMNKMTGFQMNRDGTLTDSGVKNLGLDVTQMTNYAAGIAQVTNSVGLTGEASVVTSKALSMLAGDMSSFRNLDMSTVMNNFSSGLIGQSRALYKYGIDITNATLATYAHEMGINKDISAMTQSEKMQLRMIAILDQSKVAWGDLAKTINSPSNQLRLLQNNFKALSRTIGNMFLPVVAKILPYVNGLVIAIRRLFEWTASMLGIDLKDVIGNSGGGYSDMFDGLGDVEEDANNASDAVDNTTDSVKKLAKQLMGFDELNVITTNQSSSKDSDSDSGDSAPIDLTNQLSSALADYEKVWNDAYKDMTNDAEKFADKLTKLFKSAWTSGDGSDIGSAIAGWLNKGLKWINENWSVADEKVQKIASILATAVNGFTYEFDWSGLGTALSNTLQTYLDGQTTFFDKTDWKALGSGIATSLNKFIGDGKSGPIQSYFKNLGAKLRAAIEFAFGAVTTFNFENLGTAIGQGINNFFDKMGKVDKKTGLNGWQELAKTISVEIKGIATTITTALDEVEWEEVGQAIADSITGIDWGGVVWNFGKMLSSFKKAIKRALKGAGMNGTLAGIVVNVAIGSWIIKKLSKTKLIGGIIRKIGGKLSVPLKRAWVVIKNWTVNKIKLSTLKSKIISKIGKLSVGVKKVAVVVKSWIAGDVKLADLINKIKTGLGLTKGTLSLGKIATKITAKIPTIVFPDPATDDLVRQIDQWIYHALGDKDVVEFTVDVAIKIGKFIKDTAFDIGDFFGDAWDDTTAMTEGIDVGNDLANGILKGFADALIYPANFIYNLIVKPVKDALGIHSPSTVFKEIAEYCIEGFKNGFNFGDALKKLIGSAWNKGITLAVKVKGIWDNTAKTVKDWWNGAKKKTKELIATAKGKVEKAFNNVSDAWKNFKNGTKSVVAKAKGKVEKAFDNVSDAWKSFKEGTKTLLADAKGKIEGSWDDVQSAWSSFKEGTKKLFVTAKGTVEDGFDNVSEKWKNFKEGAKEVLVKAKGDIKDSFNKVSEKWGDVKDKTVKMIASARKGELFKSIFENTSSAWKSIKSKTAILTASAKRNAAGTFKTILNNWDSIKSKSATLTATFRDFFTAPLKKAWNAIAGAINKDLKIINKIPAVNIPMIPKLAKGGIFAGGTWHNIAKYANGGLPGMGQMFVAREAGPELVGTIGGHTAVMNNNQIVQSVSDGVFNALAPVLTQVCNAVNNMNANNTDSGDTVIQIDGHEVFRAVKNQDSNYRKRTGKSAFAY